MLKLTVSETPRQKELLVPRTLTVLTESPEEEKLPWETLTENLAPSKECDAPSPQPVGEPGPQTHVSWGLPWLCIGSSSEKGPQREACSTALIFLHFTSR